ncbi:DUF4166 domain-containing protein [Falsibacillus albus]|uniref:DUF4166 domain-containing protein n=1 Tax=Falsibacillus albus TaxID=2478915 RepID=A0A3L7JSA6_9BACI|nr:DUF4166 domain-containing protein [Falsibacillus albus]RLQ93370.1 DUF4166 domain-containing protein [Falsibacillus albus]
MTSIYEEILGDNYQRLHPRLQERYRLTGTKRFTAAGVMKEITGGHFLIRQLFRFGIKLKMLFPERGRNIPFRIENSVIRNVSDKEAVVWNREFIFGNKRRHFDAVMEMGERDEEIVDYFGEPSFFVSTLSVEVTENGSIHFQSQKQYIRILGRDLPILRWFYGCATILESYNDSLKCFEIEVHITNPIFGTLLSYNGMFRPSEGERSS